MKKTILLIAMCIISLYGCQKEECILDNNLSTNIPGAFVTLWKTDIFVDDISRPAADDDIPLNDNEIMIPYLGTNYNIVWEEVGNSENNGHEIATGVHKITFPKKGIYKVSIYGGSGYRVFSFLGGNRPIKEASNRIKLISLEQWGSIEWISLHYAFARCNNLDINAKDIPNLSKVTDMGYMFYEINSFNSDLSEWDVSNVTDTRLMFARTNFNGDISNWDVSNVTRMELMFHEAKEFNQDISNWDVSNVTNMAFMFGETSFNKDISNWDVSNVRDMGWMFSRSEFNQDISGWDVSSVYSVRNMFENSNFDQDISGWDVSNVSSCIDFSKNAKLTANYKPNLPGGCN